VSVFSIKGVRTSILCVGMVGLLGGCALGIQPGDDSPSVSYVVPRSYQIVFLRAQNQAQECLRGKGEYEVSSHVDPAIQAGTVAVHGPMGLGEVARTDLKAVDAKHTEVTHTVWGHGIWDLDALNAMRESVRLDTSVCVAYR